jgi:glycosyltransferase involved in cell wall biosynthesis
MKDKLMVSVLMITYMHEKYISKAIEGVLMQQTDFEFDLIIADDCSPDQTEVIVKNIIKTHPRGHIIKYFRHTSNIGMQRNGSFALNEGKGKYIAFCEGDDYWTVPLKLQTQINFLELNSDYSMCFHPVKITMANESDYYAYPLPESDTLTLKNIIKQHYIPTCSLVLRNIFFLNGVPEWYKNSISGDIVLEVLSAAKGKTKYIHEVMACYRRNEGGISQSPLQIANIRTGYLYMYSKLASEIPFPYKLLLYKKIIRILLGIFKSKVLQLARH